MQQPATSSPPWDYLPYLKLNKRRTSFPFHGMRGGQESSAFVTTQKAEGTLQKGSHVPFKLNNPIWSKATVRPRSLTRDDVLGCFSRENIPCVSLQSCCSNRGLQKVMVMFQPVQYQPRGTLSPWAMQANSAGATGCAKVILTKFPSSLAKVRSLTPSRT